MSRIPVATNRRIGTRRQVQLGIAEQPPPIWPFLNTPAMEERLEALEAAAANEEARYRQRQARTNLGPIPFAGTVAESVEDFFTDFERFLTNHDIPDEHAARYLPDFVIGTAREFLRTLTQAQQQNITTIRQAFVAQFATQARRQAALQTFYQANQLPTETANQYYCRLKKLARAAFNDQEAAVRAQHVTARMRQGVRPEIKRLLIGREFATAEELRNTIEGIEVDVAASADETTVTKEDLKEVIRTLKNTMIDNKAHQIATLHGNEMATPQISTISRDSNMRRFRAPYNRNDNRQCFCCGRRGHIQKDCFTFKRNVFQARNNFNPRAQCKEYSRNIAPTRQIEDELPRGRQQRPLNSQRTSVQHNTQNGAKVPARRSNFINVVQQVEQEWPQVGSDESEDYDRQQDDSDNEKVVEIGQTKRKRSNRTTSPLTWLFTLMCLLMTMESTYSQLAAAPMLCQSHAAQQLFHIPARFNCSFSLHDDQQAPYNTTLQLYTTNIVKYRTDAYLCLRTETNIQRLTYFAAINHRERQTTRHIPVSEQECRQWMREKKSDDGPLVYTNKMWYTNNKAKVYWPGIFHCCYWKTFTVNNSFIMQGIVIKDHDHKMHSDLGDWRHCEYDKGSCRTEDGTVAIWKTNTKERCRYIKYSKVTGQLWGNSFMTNDQTLALTFNNRTTVKDCDNKTLHIAQQGVAFNILESTEQINYDKLRPPRSRTKRNIDIKIGASTNEKLDIKIFNVSTDKVTTGVVYPFIKYNETESRQFYVLKVNFYNRTINQYIDGRYMPKSKLNYKMYTMHVGFLHRKTYGPVFTVVKLKDVICSFVVLQVQYNKPQSRRRVRRQIGTSRVSNSFLAAQLQATIKFTEITVRHTYVHALHSTCNAMNNMLRLTQAAITEHPTIAARRLLNVTTIHARASGQLLQVWPCTTVKDVQAIPMPVDVCSARIPVRYTFARKKHVGYMDTDDHIIYASPKSIDCNMADNIPVWWNNKYQLYRRNGTLLPLRRITQLQLTPYGDNDLQLSTSQPVFRRLILYNFTDFPQLAAEDYMETAHKQSIILHQLGLTDTNSKAVQTFSANIIAEGMFNFLVGGVPSFYQIWIFTVCIVVTTTIVMKIATICCLKPCAKRHKQRYRAFAIRVKQSDIGKRLIRKNGQKSDKQDVELQSQSIQTDNELEQCPPYCPNPYTVQTYQPIYPPLQTTNALVTRGENIIPSTSSRQIQTYYPTYMAGVKSREQIQTCLPIYVGQYKKIALWDTGAELSIISGKVCHELGMAANMEDSKAIATSVCRNKLHFSGRVKVTFTIASRQFTHSFQVWPDSPFDFVLGTDFMAKCGPVAIDHNNKLFWFNEQQHKAIPLVSEKQRSQRISVALIKDITIPARSACSVSVQCKITSPIKEVEIQFDGSDSIQAKKHTFYRTLRTYLRII